MDDKNNKVTSNVIQFPGLKKEVKPTSNAPVPPPPPEKPAKTKKAKKTIAGSVIAVVLFSAAVNRYAFNGPTNGSMEMASVSGASRTIASIEGTNWERDADWEKQLAETLASAQVRDVASLQVGHSATSEEKLRWGTLEEKYTITYRPDAHEIDSIALQDASTNPSYVLDRQKFLNDYGSLLDGGYASAVLKSVEKSEEKTIESYTIFDKERHAKAEARFELDRHKRLLSLKVEPVASI